MPEVLTRGALLRDIPARTSDGRDVRVSDFRGRRNVVLIFPAQDGCEEQALAAVQSLADDPELREQEAVVLTASTPEAREAFGAPDWALFITDRYGEIFYVARHPDPLPGAAEVLKWLEFINLQCPE